MQTTHKNKCTLRTCLIYMQLKVMQDTRWHVQANPTREKHTFTGALVTRGDCRLVPRALLVPWRHLRRARGQRSVAEEAEAHGHAALGVVPGRPHDGRAAARLAAGGPRTRAHQHA